MLALVIALGIVLIRYYEPLTAIVPAALFVLLYLLFRDPHRAGASVALGVFSPVDGEVVETGRTEQGDTGAAALRILIRINSLGTYTARSPIEGIIRNPGKKALWVQSDEGADVLLKFSGYRLGLPPRAFAQFGERLGQGQRCAYLRLARTAEVQIPVDGKVLVEPGQIVVAGIDQIGSVPAPK